MKDDEIRKMVREGYAEVVERGGWGGGSAASCCGTARSRSRISVRELVTVRKR